MNVKNIVFIEDDSIDYDIYKETWKKIDPSINVFHEFNIDDRFYKEYPVSETIVFLDLKLGTHSGVDVYVEKLQNKNYTTYIHSSSDNPTDIAVCRKNGLSGYLEKKIHLDEIREQFIATLKFSQYNLLTGDRKPIDLLKNKDNEILSLKSKINDLELTIKELKSTN